MLSLIPVIFSSKFRITKIHVLPFQVIKSSHSWATPTYHCIRCVRNWVCWRDPYYPQPILRVHYNSFRQKLLHSHSVELIGLVILCVFFPFRLLSVFPGFVYKRPRLDSVFCCCYFPSLLCWLKLKKCFLFQMQQLSNNCVGMLINTQNRQKWSWTVHNWIQYIRVWGSNFVKFQNPLAQLRMMTNHYTKWLRVKRLRLVVHNQKLGKKNNGTKTKSLPNFVFKESKI